MQVNNSANIVSQAPSALGNNTSVQAQEQRTRAVARENFSSEESQSQKSQADINSKQRLDIDEQAIALVEREQLPANNSASNSTQNSQNNSYNSGYDAPSNQNQLAVAAYQSVDTIAQRDNIEQVFGVDLFA
jgi:hypothetical protein